MLKRQVILCCLLVFWALLLSGCSLSGSSDKPLLYSQLDENEVRHIIDSDLPEQCTKTELEDYLALHSLDYWSSEVKPNCIQAWIRHRDETTCYIKPVRAWLMHFHFSDDGLLEDYRMDEEYVGP